MISFMINDGVTDRRDRGLENPWESTGRHAIILNEPEQLRGQLAWDLLRQVDFSSSTN